MSSGYGGSDDRQFVAEYYDAVYEHLSVKDIDFFVDCSKKANGRTERLVQSFPMRYFFRYEIEHLLELCGFRVIDLFGDFDRSEYSSDSPELIFVAGKI